MIIYALIGIKREGEIAYNNFNFEYHAGLLNNMTKYVQLWRILVDFLPTAIHAVNNRGILWQLASVTNDYRHGRRNWRQYSPDAPGKLIQ